MKVAVAGTFGPIHDGHRKLFDHALRFGTDGIVVGLTSEAFATATRTEPREIPPFDRRREAVADTFAALDDRGRDVEIRELESEHAIAADEPSIDALVVSPETATELTIINRLRRGRGYEPLTGIVAPYVLAEDGERISSTRVVAGEIDEHGCLLE
ncbi:phosphopantetheine adenylyltransferase [Natronobacterium gregoryi]|uniref:Cytidyltransferase-related enzyme n=2 Tax=Natronobacterium gregoryi TaxID=44930 RepID=L0AET1_NATGS|nr:pantetheine-phosphate adenylyltransferase [Natronobacterium gregoryi]AFZ71944.1 cytidyltransferase-related enzyme [Natronobacterium gregoryi SP2]ELY62561.1 phosphopantetheine adenylyltransferase [Natronobacterium gregoryi SP2]PLK20721.1 phosphopantetheine adenylyltransferase [Natronobacterium gregoryi SP2]SFJ13186.1 pantetheine-phosphate adenylyltransferase [Natronobacterium gregoryi]